jgi:chloramphenicol 3-O-phosphotransferase
MSEVQAAQLVAFVVAMVGLLLALEIGMRRAHRRRDR